MENYPKQNPKTPLRSNYIFFFLKTQQDSLAEKSAAQADELLDPWVSGTKERVYA